VLALLNLTAPPVLLLFLSAAVVGNYTLPVPPASEVAAFSLGGAPLPTWVLNGTLYVLQGGEPAVAVYVPRFSNSSGVYSVAVEGPFVAQAPPGVMVVEARPQPAKVAVNKTGLYLYFDTGATIAYQAFTIQPPPTTSPPQTTPTTTISPSPTTASTPPHATTATTPSTPTPSPTSTATPTPTAPVEWLLVAVAVAVVAVLAVVFARRRRSGCGDLGDVDLALLKFLESRGGSAERAELQAALNLPKTTLHRHLHKLARYGYVRLVQEGPRQRVELLRKC